MAVAFKEQSSSGNFANQSTVSIPKPTNLATGDLIIAHIVNDGTTDAWTAPAGFLLISGGTKRYNTIDNLVWWKIADNNDVSASNFDFTIAGAVNCAGRISTFTGHDMAQPICAYNSETVTISTPSGNWNINNDITPVANSMIAMFIAFAELNATNGSYSIETDDPGGWTEIYDHGTTLGVDLSQSACYSSIRSQTTSTGNSRGTSGTASAKGAICRMIAIQPARTQTLSIINFSGFESGANNNGDINSNSTYSFDSSIKKTGNYSGKIEITDNTGFGYFQLGTYSVAGDHTGFSKSEAYFQFQFRYGVKPASNNEYLFKLVLATNQIYGRLTSDGKIALYFDTTLISTGSTVLSADTWYRIRLMYSSDNAIGSGSQCHLYINDTLELAISSSIVQNVQRLNIGKIENLNSQNVTYYFDDVIISEGGFPDPTTIVKAIKPNANGTTMSWNGGTGSSDYTQVDEIPVDDADYVMSPTSGNPNTARFNMESCADASISPSSILSLKAITRTREDISATSSTKLSVLSNATTSENNTSNGVTTVGSKARVLNTDPDTSSAWTTGGIDAVQIGAVENNAVAVRLTSVLAMILYIPSISTNYPLTAATGSFTLTSIATALKFGHKMIAALGTFTLTSIATTLSFGRKMTATLGEFTLTGINATLLYGKYLFASLGEFTLTGVNATITSTRKIVADIGTFTLTGINSVLFVGHTIVASVGEFALTGFNAIITGTRTMVGALGQFTLTGIDVAFPRASKIFANTGIFVLTGINVAFSGARKIVAAVGEFTLIGVAALFPRASKIFANTGEFTLTGYAARGLVNGVSILWTAVSKTTVATMANISKNTATWINKLKS